MAEIAQTERQDAASLSADTLRRPGGETPPSTVEPARRPRAWTVAGVIAACLALAAVSTATLPTVPVYDEFSWLVWGREVAHHLLLPHQPFVISGGPSWKPLPVALAALFALSGSGSTTVTLWMLFVRFVGLLGFPLAYRLGCRLGADPRWRLSGRVAGVLAAGALLLTQGWFGFMLYASAEPVTITAALWWVDRAWSGQRHWALAAGMTLALLRPEAAFFLAAYALWCLRREPSMTRRLAICAEVLLVAAAWLVPPWLAQGSPWQPASQALLYSGNAGQSQALIVFERAGTVVVAPVLLAALGLTVCAARRGERPALAIASISVAYLVVVEMMTLGGFPGLARFLLPGAALVCVLSGAAVARLASRMGGGRRSAAVVAAFLVAVAPFSVAFAKAAVAARRDAAVTLQSHHTLASAVARAGGAARVLPCATSSATVNWREGPMLAWILSVPLTRVHPTAAKPSYIAHPGLAFLTSADPAVLGSAPARTSPGLSRHLVTRTHGWRLVRVVETRTSRADRCVGR